MAFLRYGFLENKDPLKQLPRIFSEWEKVAGELPQLFATDSLRKIIENLPEFPLAALKTYRQDERAMMILSYLGHSYVWGEKTVPQKLPAVLAKPWTVLANKLGRHPVLSYASYALNNWRRIDPARPIELGNIALLQNFLGGIDEAWFILVHVDIEAKAVPAINSCMTLIKAVGRQDEKTIYDGMVIIRDSLQKMCQVLDRMPEHCDPYIYYHRVRPYLHGWKNHPLFPEGLMYEGVDQYHGKPQQFRGETGAQSGIIPTLDGLFGVGHQEDELRIYLREMREYMPSQHRKFLERVEKTSQLRNFVRNQNQAFREIYNDCINLIERFRSTHLHYAASYIQQQHQKTATNPHAVGTGGTPFMAYLKKHRDETAQFLL
jgi:indoleamine 2,3-dioxygenase